MLWCNWDVFNTSICRDIDNYVNKENDQFANYVVVLYVQEVLGQEGLSARQDLNSPISVPRLIKLN